MEKDNLTLNITPSVVFCLLLAASHILAVSGILYAGLGAAYQVAFTLAVFVSFLFWLFRYGLLKDPLSVVTVLFRNERWTLELKSGDKIAVGIESPVFFVSFLVVLNFRDTQRRKFPVVIFPDSVDDAQLRHSRIFLRFGAY